MRQDNFGIHIWWLGPAAVDISTRLGMHIFGCCIGISCERLKSFDEAIWSIIVNSCRYSSMLHTIFLSTILKKNSNMKLAPMTALLFESIIHRSFFRLLYIIIF